MDFGDDVWPLLVCIFEIVKARVWKRPVWSVPLLSHKDFQSFPTDTVPVHKFGS